MALETTASTWPRLTFWPRLALTLSTTPPTRGTIWAVRSSLNLISPGNCKALRMLAGRLVSSVMLAAWIWASVISTLPSISAKVNR